MIATISLAEENNVHAPDTDGSPEAMTPLLTACAGKSIAIVGNAASLCDHRRGEEIEAADATETFLRGHGYKLVEI